MTNADNFRRCTDILTERRERAESEADARRAEVHALSPTAKEIDDALAMTANRIFTAATQGGDVRTRVAKIREENAELRAARAKLLASIGLPEDYTAPRYTCPLCSDTGYVGIRMCDCLSQMLREEDFRTSGIAAHSEGETFDTFSLDYYRDTDDHFARMSENLRAARDFAEDFAPGKENLLFIGGTGLGKTHLSTAIARRVIARGFDVIYETAASVFSDFEYDRFRNGYSADTPRSEKYLTTPLLILDDLGTEFGNAFTTACLYQIVNTRMIRGLSTVISTNLTPEELNARYDERITSRFFGNYRILQFVGSDVRFQKK